MTLEELEALRKRVPGDSELPASSTVGELRALQDLRRALDGRLMRARNAMAVLAEAAPPPDEWESHLRQWRAQLCEDLLRPIPNPTPHDRAHRQNLTLSIRVCDFGPGLLRDTLYDLTTLRLGALMLEDGYQVQGADPARHFAGELPWMGSLKEIEQRARTQEKRRAQAESALADALMDEDERTRQEAEAEARRAELNALPRRKTRGDGTQFDKYPDGHIVEVQG